MLKDKILLLFSNHRVAEKLWPIIPELSKEYTLDLFLIGLHSFNTSWIGEVDEREIKVNKYKEYLNKIIVGPGIKYHGDNIKENLESYINLDDYSFIIFDDNREISEYNIPQFYQLCKSKGIKVIGNAHGNEDQPHNAIGKSHDARMDFTTGGIPANDTLKNLQLNQKHILIITNFLGTRSDLKNAFNWLNIFFDEHFLYECGALELSKQYNLPIKIKIKTRLDYPEYTNEVKYINSFCKGEVITNTDNIDQLIADSAVVISAPSTLAFKPIQLGIPTVLIKGSGAIGAFHDYPGLVNLNKPEIFNNLQMQIDHGRFDKFIEKTIAGGVNFNSSKTYIKNLKKIL
tara:strand:- start:3232 stop:4266 length:1035 start_codon:yes stop_codon:yes gene_type:complete